MRNTFADTFYELGKQDPRLAIVVADISPAGSIARFREEFPERFINTGVAEQIMIGLCAGMSLKGLRPFAYTIATFTLYRPFEFVRDDLGYQNLPVTIVGIGGGVTYSTLGATHHAMEDIAVASAIPNMQVIAPCDPAEVDTITRWCALENNAGPVYLRLGKAGEPILTQHADKLEIGKLRYLQHGKNICVLGYGAIMREAVKVADQLSKLQQAPVSIVNCHTIKPLDKAGIKKLLHSYKKIIIMEEHVPHGGLGSRVKELAWETRNTIDCEINAFSLQDDFIHVYGSHQQLLAAHRLQDDIIIKEVV